MAESTNDILRSLLDDNPELSVLWLGGGQDLKPYRDHPGRLTVLGGSPPVAWASRDFRFRLAATQAELVRALAEEAGRGPVYDLVFVDHDHRLMALHEQISLILPLLRADGLWLFDDALPPDYRMASAQPAQGWWTGQVCYLRDLLQPQGPDALLECVASAATGLLVARRIALPPRAAFEALADAAPQSQEELQRLTRPVAWADLAAKVTAGLAELATDSWLPVRCAEPEAHAVETRVIDPARSITRLSPVFVRLARPSGTDLPGRQRLEQADRRIHEKWIQTYENVLTVGYDQLLCGQEIVPRCFNTGQAKLQMMAEAHGQHQNADTGLTMRRGRMVLPREKIAHPERVPGRVFLATPDEPNNYGMWLLLALPAAREFLDHRDRYDKFLCYCERPWQKAMLAAMGLDPADIVPHDLRRSYALERVSMIRCSHRDLYVTDSERQVLSDLTAQMVATAPEGLQTGRRLFLSRLGRTQAGAYRGLVNEAELIAGLEAMDFEIIEPEVLSFADQIRLMHSADLVVGLGGAGMFNAVFCRPGTKLVDIESGMGFVDAHCNLFASMGLDYAVIFGEEDASDPRPLQKRWRLDIPRALEAITTMIAAPQAEAAQPGT